MIAAIKISYRLGFCLACVLAIISKIVSNTLKVLVRKQTFSSAKNSILFFNLAANN